MTDLLAVTANCDFWGKALQAGRPGEDVAADGQGDPKQENDEVELAGGADPNLSAFLHRR
jgi:hypothetical protein